MNLHNSVDLPRSQPSGARLWYRGYCTVAFALIYPGSPFVSVVEGSADAVIRTPAKRSYPEKDRGPVRRGALPFCDVDGVSEIWNAPSAFVPCGILPILHDTVLDALSYENVPVPAVMPVYDP